MAHERLERRALLAFCQTALWSQPMHHLCAGRGIVQRPLPGSPGPWTTGICTCPCHETDADAERDGNAQAWEYWRANRATLQERCFELDRMEGKPNRDA